MSRAIVKGQHFAEITVLLDNGELSTLLGPARRNRPEALKDCLELRKVAMKCTDDSKLLILKKRKKELEDVTWTVKDLGGRLLDGAEGPPPGFKPPSWMPQADAVSSTPLGYVSPGKYRAPVKPTAKEEESVYSFKTRKLVECAEADVKELVSSGDWESKAKVALQQAFKKFGPVLEIRVDFKSDDGEKVASVRFASAKAVELAMSKALRGWLPVGDKHVRVRQPAVEAKAEWRTFVAPRRAAPALESAPNKKRLRPNERFANKKDVEDEETNNFDAQTGPHSQATPKAVPVPPMPEPAQPEPDRPVPLALEEATSVEDREVAKGEEEVAREMKALLQKPFSQQKKALKAIRAKWHPDKNPDAVEVATRVFQFIQAHDEWLQHHGLA